MLSDVATRTHHYVGMTEDIENRLAKHNAGQVPHTSKFAPWTIDAAIAVRDKTTAAQLERYLKSGSGRAFANKHLFATSTITRQGSEAREAIRKARRARGEGRLQLGDRKRGQVRLRPDARHVVEIVRVGRARDGEAFRLRQPDRRVSRP